jgi:uncharacterized RDD family membrane protein YckC
VEEWWYSVSGKRKGPVGIEALRKLNVEGTIDGTTLVWREGMAEWTRIADTPELAALRRALPPELPRPTARDKVIAMAPAGAWRRFFARIFDLWFLGLLVAVVVGLVGSRLSMGFAGWLQEPGNDFVLGWLLVPAILFAEALVFGTTGTTLGKALLGVKVVTAGGGKLSLGQYLQRLVGVYWEGLGTGFPFVSLFTMAWQGRRLADGRKTSYDKGLFEVKAPKLGVFRGVFAAFAVFALLVVNVTVLQIGKEVGRAFTNSQYSTNEVTAPPHVSINELPASAPPSMNETPVKAQTSINEEPVNPQSWRNELTGKTVQLPAGWVGKEIKNSSGDVVPLFDGPFPGLRLTILTGNSDGQLALSDYAEQWRQSAASALSYPPGTVRQGPDGVAVWESYGYSALDSSQPRAVAIVQRAGRMWHINTVADGEMTPASAAEARRVVDILLTSL